MTPTAASAALVHHWPGNGDATDAVGTADGVLSGGVSFTAGLLAQGFAFDGVDGEVSFPGAEAPGAGDFTVAFAIRTTMSDQLIAAVLSKRPACNSGQSFWDIRLSSGRLGMEIYSAGGTNYGGGSTVAVNDGVLHTVVVTRAGTTVSFYVDGGPAQSSVHPDVADVSNDTAVRAGDSICVGADSTVRFAGILDEIRYGNTADPGLLAPPAPVLLEAPAISSGGGIGDVVACPDGTWRYHPTSFAREWLRDGSPIAGAAGETYALVAEDAARTIVCRVTATNAGGSTSADSNALAPTVPPAPPPPPPAPPAPPAPAPVTGPAPVTAAAPGPLIRVAVERIATLPSAKACVSRRAFRIRLRHVKQRKVITAVIKLNGKQVRRVRGRALALPINLRGLPKGRFVVEIVTTDAKGKRLVARRAYRTCVPKRR